MTTLTQLSQNRTSKLVALLLVAIFLIPSNWVSAATVFCRADPIVFLSDGARLQFNTGIETSADNVASIDYNLHVPVGVTVDRIVYTPKWARSVEHVNVIADQPAGSYLLYTSVTTVDGSVVAVEVDAMYVAKKNGGKGSSRASVSGNSGQTLFLSF